MYYVLSKPFGQLFYCSRWVLTLFKWTAVGALLLAALYTLTARLADYAFCLPRRFEGTGFVLALAQIGWMAWRGTNLYYKSEPSLFVLIAVATLLLFVVLAGGAWIIKRRKAKTTPALVRPWGLIISLVLTGCTWGAVRYFNENVIFTARMQNLCAEGRWDEMIALGRSARQPSRAVAAYYAIALNQRGQLLDGLFDIPYEYPKLKLDTKDGAEEYGIFLADCNFYAGLLNPSYRAAMDRVVMDGPRLYYLKRMALCALLSGEKELCEKYLTIIGRSPFEKDFVEKYKPMLADQKKLLADEDFSIVLALNPDDDHFEQNYMPPAFLGYNVGLNKGSNKTLYTSAAACLYGKDLNAFIYRAEAMAKKGLPFPACMQQAIAIMALKQPELLKRYPQVGRFVPSELTSFLLDAKPYVKDRLALRHNLREQWLGSYIYYYYTENNDPDQVIKTENKESKAGVN